MVGQLHEGVEESLQFKFQLLNDQGQETGGFKRGELVGEHLILNKIDYPLAAVVQVVRRMNRIVIVLIVEGAGQSISMSLNSGRIARQIKERVDAFISSGWAESRRRELEEAGNSRLFRSTKCPHCQATVDLTGFANTPEIYCVYCETLSRVDSESSEHLKGMRLCDFCSYFSKPEPFTSFYFYFLLVVYGFQSKTTHRCHACMRSEAWTMLVANAIFVLGVPFAVWQLVRAYFKGAHRSSFPKLDAANRAAADGNVERAERLYQAMLESVPLVAGVHLNRSKAYAKAADWRGSLQAALESLAACSNYTPAASMVLAALRAQNLHQDAEVFEKHWGKEGFEEKSAES